MKKQAILYWIPTGLLCAFMLFSVTMYTFNYPMITEAYTDLGFPVYLVYFNGTAKLLGAVALLAPLSKLIKEWAYAGLFYLLLLALIAHLTSGDNMYQGAVIGLVLWIASYWQYKKRA